MLSSLWKYLAGGLVILAGFLGLQNLRLKNKALKKEKDDAEAKNEQHIKLEDGLEEAEANAHVRNEALQDRRTHHKRRDID